MAVPVQVDLNPNTKKVDAELARIRAAAKGVDFGGGARSIEKLSRPLGKITGQATEFQKSLEASNARVLAFGASVAVINKLSEAFGALVSNTIKVEATFAKIGVILGGTQKDLQEFGRGIFDVAKSTATSFDQVAEGALELARQGLSTEESLSRVETALKLVRVAGIDSQKAVAGLTAAIKGFEGAGLTVGDIADKLAEVDTKFAVSTEDLINGLERASASARVAGVSFDELLGVVTTVQERTQRGGAVIGNAFKTIFARLGRSDTLVALEEIGIKTLDASGNVRSAIPLFQELAVKLNELGLKSVEAGEIIQKVAGVRQRDILISLVEDLTSGQSQFAKSLQVSSQAAGALDQKNQALNQTLEALISKTTTSGQQLASVLGEIGFADSAKDILKGLSSVLGGITKFLDGDSIGSKFAQGLISGIGSILTGPGLALIGAIFLKLFVDLSKFGVSSLKSLLGLNRASQQQQALQQSVLQTLLQNESVQASILRLEGDKVSQEQLLLKIYNEQAAALARVQKIAANVTPALFGAGLRGGEGGVKPKGKASGGYIAAEARDVSRGVGGAPANSRVVSIPNFAFGGGQRGTMVANTSEYIVPNFAGGGDAIFNRDMVRSMGLPAGARKINAAGGFIPNFVKFGDLTASGNRFQDTKTLLRASADSKFRPPNKDGFGSLSNEETKRIIARGKQTRGAEAKRKKGDNSLLHSPNMFAMIVPSLKGVNEVRRGQKGSSNEGLQFTIVGYKGLEAAKRGVSNDEQLDKVTEGFALDKAFSESKLISGGRPTSKKLEELSNKGAISALSGAIFETAVSSLLKSDQFDPKRDPNARFDFLGDEGLDALFNLPEGAEFIDAKIRNSADMQKSMFGKMKKQLGRAAGGFIPNFAGGALEEAIGREKAAGLPINQIRVNQSGKLRNSKNPMGLAVTNTRDEPTGRIPSDSAARGFIPNFAKGEASQSLDKAAKSAENFSSATDGALGKILLLQTISFGLSGTFSTLGGETDGFGKRLAEAANAASSFITTLITLQAAGLVGGDSSKAITNVLGKLLGSGKGLGRAASKGFKIGKLQSTGVASAADAAKGTARLMASFGPLAKTAFNLSKLFGRFVPFIGPVILGFQALSGLSKVIFGVGLIEGFKNLAGLNKKSSEVIQEEIAKRKELISQLGDPEDVRGQLEEKQRLIKGVDAPEGRRTELKNRIAQNRKRLFEPGQRLDAQKQLKGDQKDLRLLDERIKIAKGEAEALKEQLSKLTIGKIENEDGSFKSFKSLSQLVDDIKSNLQDGLISQKDAQLTTELANNFAIAKAELNGVNSVLKDINDLQAIQNNLQNANTEAINNSKTSILDSVKGIEEYKGIEKIIGEEFEKRISQATNAKEIQGALNFLAQKQQGIGYSLTAIFKDQNAELERQLVLNKANAVEAEKRKQDELGKSLLNAQDKGEKLTRDAGLYQLARTGGEGGYAASPERVAQEKARLDEIEAGKKFQASVQDFGISRISGDENVINLAKENAKNAQLELNLATKKRVESERAFDVSKSTLTNELLRAETAAKRTKSDNETLRSLELQLASSDQLTSRQITALELQKESLENTRSQFDIEQKIEEIKEKIKNAPAEGTDEDAVKRLEKEKKELEDQKAELEKILQLKQDVAKVEMFKTFGDGLKAGTASIRNDIDNFQYKLGEQIPLSFADNMGQAMKDAVSGAKDLDDALSSAAENFLGMIRDAFLQQAADQFTNTLFGGGPTAVFGGPGGGGQKNIFSSISGLFGRGSSVAGNVDENDVFQEGFGQSSEQQASPAQQASGGGLFSKVGGFFGDLFGGGKKGGGAPGSTPTNPLFVQDVANAIGGGAAGGADTALELATGEGEGEGIGSKISGYFSNIGDSLKSTLGDVFGNLTDTFKNLFSGEGGIGGIFSSLLGGGPGGGGLGGLIGSLFGSFGGGSGILGIASSLFGFNKGGIVPTIRGYANGGSVGSTDTVPAMLTPGEFVVKKSAVDKYGTDFLSSLNRGILPMSGFQNGGSVSPVSSEMGSSGVGGNQVNNTSDFTFNIQDGKVSQEGGQASSENQREFASRIRSAVTTVIQEESRSGGTLSYLYKK